MFGTELQSPIVIGSSPASCGADAMIACHRAGAGAVVSKTISKDPACNPDLHMVQVGQGALLNCEKWTDLTMDRWLDVEMPRAVAAGVRCIASVGHTVEDSRLCVERLEEIGVMAVELVSYDDATILPMLEDTKRRVGVPVIVKLSPTCPDLLGLVRRCVDAGADGITACDSVGPAMRIDIETGKPLVGSPDGAGWLSGSPILALAVQRVCVIRRAFPDVTIVGLGGVSQWQDGIELLTAGADFVGVASAVILQGPSFVTRMNDRMDEWMSDHRYASLDQVRGRVLDHLPVETGGGYEMGFDFSRCRHCGRCVRACAYRARRFDEGGYAVVDESRCRHCGLCVSVCGFGALSVERGFIR